MLIVGIILALVLDRSFPALRSYRPSDSLSNYFRWTVSHWVSREWPRRMIPAVIILPVLLLIGLLNSLFQSGVFSFGFYLLIAFVCLQPAVLNEDVDDWIKEMHNDTSQAGENALRLFGLANRSLYTVIFWLVVLGPLAAVAYRLLDRLGAEKGLLGNGVWTGDVLKILSWFEWLPALVSSFLFMVCGNFEAGLKGAQSVPYFASNLQVLNESRLRQVGQASLTADKENETGIQLIQRCRGLLLRSLALWIVLAAILDYWL